MAEKLSSIDVVITIRSPAGVPTSVLRSISGRVEREIYFSELRDLKAMLEVVPKVNEKVGKRLQADLYKNRNSGAVITRVATGSIEVTIAVLGAAYWLLDKTIGKSFQEAYAQTGTHAAIKKVLLLGEKKKVVELAEAIEVRALPPPSPTRPNGGVHVRREQGRIVIDVQFDYDGDLPPSRDKI